MTVLQSLIERVEAATEGSRELDYEIARWKMPKLAEYHQLADGRWETPDGLCYATDYTTSIDAAESLVPPVTKASRRKMFTFRHYGDVPSEAAAFRNGSWHHGKAQTDALALCAAALRAQAAGDMR